MTNHTVFCFSALPKSSAPLQPILLTSRSNMVSVYSSHPVDIDAMKKKEYLYYGISLQCTRYIFYFSAADTTFSKLQCENCL